jgi:uncharacterized protein YcsI (UPF0317 family)
MMSTPELTEAQTARLAMRAGTWQGDTLYRAPGFVQTNLVVVPQSEAYEFLLYCQRNPQACPVLEVTDAGNPEPKYSAPGADLRTDLPKYAIYRNGVREEDHEEIKNLWHDDSVAFLIGSGMTFDFALHRAGVPKYEGRPHWMVRTNLQTVPAGKFRGPVIATMRWMTAQQAIIATQVTARFYRNHGAPIHIGDPSLIGADLQNPLVGGPVPEIPREVVPVFWACGVTPQYAALECQLPLMITHAPRHAFITDLQADQICLP